MSVEMVMRADLILLSCCFACAHQSTPPRLPVAGQTTTYREEVPFIEAVPLTSRERAKVIEAILFFRLNAFPKDTLLLDGCSVALTVDPGYRALLRSDFARLVSAPAKCGAEPDRSGYARRLVLDDLVGAERSASARVSYVAGGYTHFEWYTVRRTRPTDDWWYVVEMQVNGAMIID